MITIIAIIFFYIAPIVLVVKIDSHNPLIILLMIGIWIIDSIILYDVCDWYEEVGSTTPKLSYRAFIKLYNVMPDDFSLHEYDFYYKDTIIDFKTFPDWWRYRRFYKNIEKHKTEQEQLQRQAALISELQRGLTQQQAKVDSFIKEKLNEQTQFFNGN